MTDPLNRVRPFIELVKRRTSCRSYKPDPVPREYIERMLEAARHAPSACNKQPWRFAVVIDPELRGRLARNGVLPGLSSDWIAGAPVLVALGMECAVLTHRFAPLFSGVDYPWIDLGIAGEHFVLQAEELGLGTCWVGWIRPRRVRKLVGWPRHIRPAALITLGYPLDTAPARRTDRHELSEIVRWVEA